MLRSCVGGTNYWELEEGNLLYYGVVGHINNVGY